MSLEDLSKIVRRRGDHVYTKQSLEGFRKKRKEDRRARVQKTVRNLRVFRSNLNLFWQHNAWMFCCPVWVLTQIFKAGCPRYLSDMRQIFLLKLVQNNSPLTNGTPIYKYINRQINIWINNFIYILTNKNK